MSGVGVSVVVRHPVVFFIFNRPDLTQLVFDVIRRAAPTTLYVIADGPRHEADAPLCAEARAVVENVDWPCTVHKLFREQNLGCGRSVSSGIDYVFEREEAAIFLEDDTLPSDSFFTYCDELLDRYRNNPRIVHIGAVCYWASSISTRESYYFSRYPHVGAWATWRRAWSYFDFNLTDYESEKTKVILRTNCHNLNERIYWNRHFLLVKSQTLRAWGYQWVYACWKQNGLAITPTVSLVKNLGFRSDATHTVTAHPLQLSLNNNEINEIVHPKKITRNRKLDRKTYRVFFQGADWSLHSLKRKVIWELYLIYKKVKTLMQSSSEN